MKWVFRLPLWGAMDWIGSLKMGKECGKTLNLNHA